VTPEKAAVASVKIVTTMCTLSSDVVCLRNALHQFAWQSTRQEEWAATYYRRKREGGKSHAGAVRALANQWVRIIYALWRKREPYNPATFLAAQQAHAPRAA